MVTKKKLKLAKACLTDEIFVGHVLKDGRTWAANRQNVTNDFYETLFLLVPPGSTLEVTSNGKPKYRIIIEEIV